MAEGGTIRKARRDERPSTSEEAGESSSNPPVGALGGRAYGRATRQRMFSEEEYIKCQNIKGPIFRGFSFMSVQELNSISKKWKNKNLNSANPYFLRGLAVIYFYQSQMSKARELLLKILENGLFDIDVSLMLAECACALPEADEALKTAIERVCGLVAGKRLFTPQHIDEWDAKLKKNGRFMGYIILQYALHQKFQYDSNEILKRPSFAFIKNVTKRLEEVSEDVQKKPHEQLIAAIQTFINAMIECRVGFPPDCRTSAYVEALCFNFNAWSLLCKGKYQAAHDSANEGLHIMEYRYRGDENERALYGDLRLNKGAALDRLGQHEKARIEFDQAVEIYQTRVKDHPDEIRKGKIIANAKSCSPDTTLRSYDIM